MRDRMTDEMSTAEIAKTLGLCRQSVWLYLQIGRIKGARKVAGRWWVAPRSEVLAAKRLMDAAKAEAENRKTG